MTSRTRYFVIASLLILTVGLGTGLLAYYVGFPTSASTRRGGPDELQFVPKDAAVIAYADVREVMNSELRQRVKAAAKVHEDGQREFRDETGINIETDIDRVVAYLDPGQGDQTSDGGLVLARGRFDEVRIESLIREHGGRVEDYGGKRVLVVDTHWHAKNDMSSPDRPDGPDTDGRRRTESLALSFLEPGLAAVGNATLVRKAIDLQHGGENVTANDALMDQIRSLDGGNAWAVGRFDQLRGRAHLPQQVASQIPDITWFSVSSHIDGGLRGTVRAEARDEAAANNLRDVVRGFMALARMQTSSKPELQTMLQSLELGGAGKTVSLSFTVPAELFDTLGAAANGHKQPGR